MAGRGRQRRRNHRPPIMTEEMKDLPAVWVGVANTLPPGRVPLGSLFQAMDAWAVCNQNLASEWPAVGPGSHAPLTITSFVTIPLPETAPIELRCMWDVLSRTVPHSAPIVLCSHPPYTEVMVKAPKVSAAETMEHIIEPLSAHLEARLFGKEGGGGETENVARVYRVRLRLRLVQLRARHSSPSAQLPLVRPQIADSTAPFQHSSLAAKLMANTAHGQHSSLPAQLPFGTAHGQHSQLAASQVTASTARSQGSLRPAHLTTHGRVRGHSPTDRHLALRRIDHGFEFLVVPSGDPLAPFS